MKSRCSNGLSTIVDGLQEGHVLELHVAGGSVFRRPAGAASGRLLNENDIL